MSRVGSLVLVSACLVLVGSSVVGQKIPDAADRLLRAHGVTAPPQIYREALAAFLAAEAAYRGGHFSAARSSLDAFWAAHPPGTAEWSTAYRDAWAIQRSNGVNIGAPPCYYALRMLTECVRWRLSSNGTRKPVVAVQLTVVLVGRSHGTEPRTRDELEAGRGVAVARKLEPQLLTRGHPIIYESLWLFREYMRAATDGRMAVRVYVHPLPSLDVPVAVTGGRMRLATLSGDAWHLIWTAVPEAVRSKTDWWWILYPSAVPEQHPDFEQAEFITGGMGTGLDGVSPCFIIDDRWLTRKPPHLGKGPYSAIERRAYLPQWLQHEFFHHLFRTYPEFGLEKRDHQWFDRSTWPGDFSGVLEPDYYDEALQKRLKPLASPPLHVALRYAPPPAALFRRIRLSDLPGTYVHHPIENDWHVGTLEMVATNGTPRLKWTNRAGASWILRPDLERGILLAGPDCPYYDARQPEAAAFRIRLRRNENGDWAANVEGFAFQGGLYRLQTPDRNATR